eukprot:c52258_g1_i1.p1 GENE.c52258_g1_i1~~c52258_g1_i1.p1  ORF type:complete len:276 (+),score=69.88 c52258_g1_i1:37-864(+)
MAEDGVQTQLQAGLDLMRRLPPSDVEDNLFFILDLVPDLTESLLSAVDQPLKLATDEAAGRDYLLCDYNRDGDSFRSPWSNVYYPPLEDATIPSDKLREMEEHANQVFDRYREVYFGTGSVSSVYFWDLGDEKVEGWAACVLMYKEGGSGVWNSIHVVEVTSRGDNKFQYKLTSSVMLTLTTPDTAGKTALSGTLTRQDIKELGNPKNDVKTHISNMGRVIEEMENRMRTQVDVVYFGKTQEVLDNIHPTGGTAQAKTRTDAQKQLFNEMRKSQE